MSTLLLVRHGQARPFEADSDRLSERGEEQARRTGTHLVAAFAEIDEVHTGTLVRHRQTADLVASAFREAGKPWPEPRPHAGWNEYPADDIVSRLLPAFAAKDPAFARLVEDFQARGGDADRNRYFQRMFEVLMSAWQEGRVEARGVELFEEFHGRVREALSAITDGRSRHPGHPRTSSSVRVLVFTSGGPIGVSVQEVVGGPKKSALELNFRVKNASLTELVFGPGRVTLDSFNSVAHLPEALRTFR